MKLILIGGGGHAKSCISCIDVSKYNIIGIIDRLEKIGNYISGHQIIDSDENIKKYIDDGCEFLITIGQLTSAEKRKMLFNEIKKFDGKFSTIISPDAYIANNSEIGNGTIVMHNSIINDDVKIGLNCIINNGAIIEHDVEIGDHCHISTGTIINGACKIGHECLIGSGSIIKNEISLCNKVIIGAGSVVIRDILESGIYAGNPAKMIGKQ